MDAGYTDKIFGDLFHTLFSPESEANILAPTKYPSISEVIEEVHNAGAVAILAHPAFYNNFDEIEKYRELGIDGIEAVSYTHLSGVVVFLRFIAHFFSGWILWGSYAESFFAETMNNAFGQSVLETFSGQSLAVVYSLVYNGSYMLPELLVTVLGVLALMAVKPVRKLIVNEDA